MATESDDLHRIGGGSAENLRLKTREVQLEPPGISVLKASAPGEAARQIMETFADAKRLQQAARVVGSSSVDKIRSAGFEVIAKPTRKLPNHHRIIHPEGAAGFNEDNLKKLSEVFKDTLVHES